MAMTCNGMAPDCTAYDRILYVSKDRLDLVTKSLKSGKAIDNKTIDELMVPEDLADKAILVPVDVSDEATFGEVYDGHEDMVERLGAKGVAEAVIAALERFENGRNNFKA